MRITIKQKWLLAAGLFAAGASLVYAQGLPIKSGDSSVLARVNANLAMLTAQAESDVATYTAGVTNVALTAAGSDALTVESEAGRGFRITKLCINPGAATAAASVQWQLIRTDTASSGGTQITAEVTSGNNFNSKRDPADGSWLGVVRASNATEGASNAILDAGNLFVNAVATPPTVVTPYCRDYGLVEGKQPKILAGTTNGVKLMWEGTAGGIDFSASLTWIAD